MLVDLLVFAVGAVVGAYSHKWLAAEVTKETGLNVLDPVGVAKQVETVVKDVVKKV